MVLKLTVRDKDLNEDNFIIYLDNKADSHQYVVV